MKPSFLVPVLAALTLVGCNAASDLVSVDPSKIVHLSVSASTIPADGISEVVVTARVPMGGQTEAASVNFTTTRGEFVGASDPRDHEVVADSDGVAKVWLRSSTEVGVAHIQAVFGVYASSVDVEFVPVVYGQLDLGLMTSLSAKRLSEAVAATAVD